MSAKITAETYVPDWVKNHPKVKLCAGHCNRYTRHGSMKNEDFPGTVVRSVDQKCQKCLNDERRAGPAEQRKVSENLRHTITGLEHYIAGRRTRLGQS